MNIEKKKTSSPVDSKNWQKLCTAEDYNHKQFQDVLKEVFKKPASYHRKQWEFVVIYLNLLKNNKIDENFTGASFGAGREPLIYLIGSQVKKFIATDLYVYNTGWQTAKIKEQQSCKEFVMEKAPKGLDVSGIEVEEMDMRKLDFNDESLDFCYSSCAFEHIGHEKDFIEHLKEVRRVLKEDGIYVMTTEYLFNHETFKVKGNYKFDMKYLHQIFQKSGLFPDPTFDATVDEVMLNKPKLDLSALSGMKPSILNSIPSLILEKQGVPYTSCCFVLRKQNDKNIDIEELECKKAQVFTSNCTKKNVAKLFATSQFLNPISGLKKGTKTILADHIEYLSEDHEDHFESLKIDSSNFVHTDFVFFSDNKCRFDLNLICAGSASVKVNVVEKSPLYVKGRKTVISKKAVLSKGANHLSLEYQCHSDKVYALTVSTKDELNHIDLRSLTVKAKILA